MTQKVATIASRTFTIGIPVRNGERFLNDAISSALAQTRTADEVLVVDDGSTDNTRAIATNGKWQGRVRYVYNDSPTGVADAFNRVARCASSDFISFLSADDILDPGFLAVVEGGLSANPEAKFCYVASDYIDAQGRPLALELIRSSALPQLYDGKTYIHNYLVGCLTGNEIHRCLGTTIDRALFLETCQFRKEAGIMADNDSYIRMALHTDVVGIAQSFASVRIHGNTISSRTDSLSLRVAEDYLFQVRCMISEPHYLAKEDMPLIHELAVRNINFLLYEAILRGRKDLCTAGIELMEELNALAGDKAIRQVIRSDHKLLRLIYQRGWAVCLYRAAVYTAAVARPVKHIARRLLQVKSNSLGTDPSTQAFSRKGSTQMARRNESAQ